MSKTKILIGFIVLFCMLFTAFEISGSETLSIVSRALIVPNITVLYFIRYRPKLCCFAMFLVLFSLAELISVTDLIPYVSKNLPYAVFYYTCNGLYVLAYLCLVFDIVKSLNLKRVVKNFFVHLLVLGFLNGYLLYVLFNIINPYLVNIGERIIELLYTIAILLVLSASLINFLYKDTRKSLLLFLGSLCIVFSEVIQIAYLYISKKDLLDVFYTTLLVLAFFLFYRQATILGEDESSVLSGKEVF